MGYKKCVYNYCWQRIIKQCGCCIFEIENQNQEWFDGWCRLLSYEVQYLKVRETQEGGWIMLAFSSFSPTEVNGQKQLDYIFWSDVQNLNATDKNIYIYIYREREREREQLYRFLPQTGSSHIPLALPRRVH